jgi:hypothetical protein
LANNEVAILIVVGGLLGAIVQAIGSASAPLVQAAIEAHKEKMPAL